MKHTLGRWDGAHPDADQVQVARTGDVWCWVAVYCGACRSMTAVDPFVIVRDPRAECEHCGAVGWVPGRDRRALQRRLYDRDAAALDRRDTLAARQFLARHVPRGDQGLFDTIEVVTGLRYWTCPRCAGVDPRGRPVGRRPRAEYDCWRCGWSHYDQGPPFVAVIDGDRLARGDA